MKRLLILLVILLISISAVSASDNLTDNVSNCVDDSLLLNDGNHVVEENFNDSLLNEADADETSQNSDNSTYDIVTEVNSTQSNITIQAEDLVWYYKANPIYTFNILDSNGTGIAAENVKLTIGSADYYINTDENGSGKLPINLKAGNYQITVEYNNMSVTRTIDLFSSRIIHTKNLYSTYGKKVKYVVRVLDNAGNPMALENVTFSIGSKTLIKRTNSNGYAAVTLNYDSGKYVIKYSTNGFSGKNTYTVKNYISLKILKWGLKGYVGNAPLIKNNMPNNKWVKKAVAATKKGLPLITIKGGKGKVVFMTAGVHGNELNSQVAAMKMIKYLTTHNIKGTVYIVPFVNVKAISQKVRYTNYDFNRVAHKSGTVSNKLVKLVLKYKCDAYGDFHTTVSPGVPGINVVLGYTSPNKCVGMTKYISKNANVNKIFYYPGQKYRWSLADWVNSRGTPAVICEVISPVNQVSSHATSLSYKEMTAFLNYNKII